MKRVHANVVVNVHPRQSVEDIAGWVQRTYDFFHPRVKAKVSHEPDASALLGDLQMNVRRYTLTVEIDVPENLSKADVVESIQKFYTYQHPSLEAVVTLDGSFVDGFALLGIAPEDEPLPADGLALLEDPVPDIPPDGLALLEDPAPPGAELLN